MQQGCPCKARQHCRESREVFVRVEPEQYPTEDIVNLLVAYDSEPEEQEDDEDDEDDEDENVIMIAWDCLTFGCQWIAR